MAADKAIYEKIWHMIEARNIFYQIHRTFILSDISVRIETGKFTAILGPNGAGKSTLLKCLTGALRPDKGNVMLDEKSLHDYTLEALAKKRAVLSQSNAITFPFTATDIVMMGRNPYAKNASRNRDQQAVYEAFQCLDILHLKDRIFPTLSGGEQQHVQLARVLAQLWEQKQAYFFLDEPTSALDLKHQHHLLTLLRDMALTKQFAICIIIHNLHLALRYADKAILLKGGKLFASGNIDEVLTEKNIESVYEISPDIIL